MKRFNYLSIRDSYEYKMALDMLCIAAIGRKESLCAYACVRSAGLNGQAGLSIQKGALRGGGRLW